MLKMHTFEMKKIFLTGDEFTQVQYNLYDVGYKYYITETSQIYTYYVKKGVSILLIRGKYAKSTISIKINPQKVLGDKEQEYLFELTEYKFTECLKLVCEMLEKNKIKLTDFKISRIDFTRDIRFEKSEIIDIYIKLLNKTGAPFRYKYKEYGSKIYEDSYEITNSFWSVAVYNKERESMQRNKRNGIMYGVMRIEVRIFESQEMKQIFSDGALYFDRVIKMQELAIMIMKNVFVDGFYIKLEKTKKVLYKQYNGRRATKRQKNKIERMVKLSETIAIHRSVYDCIRGTNALYAYDTINDIKRHFVEERINLVSISAKEHFSVLPDMKYLLGIKTESEVEKDKRFLLDNNLINKMPKYSIL